MNPIEQQIANWSLKANDLAPFQHLQPCPR